MLLLKREGRKGEMKGKTLLCLALVASMLLSVFMVGSVGAQLTTIGVEPDEIIDVGLVPGSSFTVNITVRDVADLAGVEFKLGYNTMVLTADLIEYGGIFGPTFFQLINETYEADGYLHFSIMQMFGEPGVGDGLAAIIHFTVDSVGESALDLYDVKLGDSDAVPIPCEELDGYFRNALESATLVRKSAWPEHHHYRLLPGWDEDSSNDLFAIVCNDGEVDRWVKVVFTVTKDGTGLPQGDFETPTMYLLAGAIYGTKADARYKAEFIPESEGKYYVSAECWVDTTGDTVPDTAMGKVKAFSFSVVP